MKEKVTLKFVVKSRNKALTSKICWIPKSDFQSFFNVLTQISPFDATFGWKILVRKNALGGCDGKSFGNVSLTRNAPLAYGVPAGPSIIAWISVTSASLIKTLIPSNAFVCRPCNSLTTCLMICGLKFSTLDICWKGEKRMKIIPYPSISRENRKFVDTIRRFIIYTHKIRTLRRRYKSQDERKICTQTNTYRIHFCLQLHVKISNVPQISLFRDFSSNWKPKFDVCGCVKRKNKYSRKTIEQILRLNCKTRVPECNFRVISGCERNQSAEASNCTCVTLIPKSKVLRK